MSAKFPRGGGGSKPILSHPSSRWGGNKSITKVVIYQIVGLGLKAMLPLATKELCWYENDHILQKSFF